MSATRRGRAQESDVGRHCDPRGAPRPQSSQDSAATGARGVPHRGARHIEIDADERIAAVVVFDLDDLDAAFEELEARYLAGEAAAHAHTWSVMAEAFAALNRHELPPTTPD